MQRLKPAMQRPGCLVLFGLFWLSFSLIWTYFAWRGGGGLFALFGVPFIAIGLFLLGGALWNGIARARLGRPELTVSQAEVAVGETFGVEYRQRFRTSAEIYNSRIELLFRESATYTQGTDTRTDRHEEVLDYFDGPAGTFPGDGMAQQAGTFTIPRDGMHSFTATNNKLQWFVRLKVDVKGWPDLTEEYELRVLPARVS